MKKIRNVMLLTILLAGTSMLTFGQDVERNNTNNLIAASTDPARNSVRDFSNLRIKNFQPEAAKKTIAVQVKKTDKKNPSNQISVTNDFIKGSISSLQQIKKREDGSHVLNLKQSSSVVGNIAIDDADIIYDNRGIAGVKLTMQKSKGAAFITAHIAAYGKPNNENVMDSYSWILGEFVLEILEGQNNFVANYRKATPADQYINEGAQLTLK
jgi:hypothetical protein